MEISMIKNKTDFIEWIDLQLDVEIPDDIIAFNINIYESPFNIEIIGSSEYTPDDDDWACNEDWIPVKRISQISDELFEDSWQKAELNIISFTESYLSSNSKNVNKLKLAKALTVGFVDGDLNYVQ